MCLEHKIIPPIAHFQIHNPKIPFEEARLVVPKEPSSWPVGRCERVSVNSFGIGGSNGHAILESAPPSHQRKESEDDRSQLLVISAQSKESLQNRVNDVAQYVNENPHRLSDLAYTLGIRREHLEHRAFTIAEPNTLLAVSSFETSHKQSLDTVTFVFTGQGAQWPGMGRALMEEFDCFRQVVENLDRELQTLDDRPDWSLKGRRHVVLLKSIYSDYLLIEEIICSAAKSQINGAEFSQPLCTAVQIGLIDILAKWGIQPSNVVGHSSGEIAAAYAARAISARSAIILAYYRGKVVKVQEGLGSMAAVGLGPVEVAPFIESGVCIACHNSPRSVTLSGNKSGIDRALERISVECPGTLCRRLRVQIAYHSGKSRPLHLQSSRTLKSRSPYAEHRTSV